MKSRKVVQVSLVIYLLIPKVNELKDFKNDLLLVYLFTEICSTLNLLGPTTVNDCLVLSQHRIFPILSQTPSFYY